jgi:predicted dehydrogenase
MNGPYISRRGFLGGVAGTAAVNVMRSASAQDSSEQPKVKAGLIGLGGRGKMIAQLIQEHGGYQLSAIADYFPEVLDAAGQRFEVPEKSRFSGLMGYQRLLESGVDAVFLETPPYCFPDHVEAAVEAGLHVYMAKPVACDVPGCLRVSAAAQRATEAKKVFLIDFQTRTDPFFIEGVDRVRKGEIGALGMLSSLYTDESFSDPPLTETVESRLQHLIWVNDDALGGSYLVNAGIHAIDVALWVAGGTLVSAVGASRVARNEPHGDSHDVYSVTYEFASGLILNHRGEHLKNRFSFHCECMAYGQNGYLESGYSSNVAIYGGKKDWPGGQVKDLYVAGARRNIATFHDSIVNGNCANLTVQPSINANLAAMLGREAALRRTRLTWDEMIKESRRIEPDLRGLKA